MRTIDFGIDLGTTNSSIALCRGGETRIFQSNDLMNVTPSVVYVGKTGRMLVGKRAYDIWVQDPENTQAEFKRWMGFNDRLAFPASGKTMAAEELSAEVLKALRADAARQSQEEIHAAVITVPAAFGSLQCEATGRAAQMAGFTQAPLLQEPIAAAVAYGAGPASRNRRLMVFDLGGGTLDIAVVSTRNDSLTVLEHQGDNRLGGKDIDRAIAEAFLLAPLAQTFALPDRRDDAPAFARLHRALVRQAEQAKIALSTSNEVAVDLFELGQDRDGKPIELTLTLRREEVEAQIGPLIRRCLALAARAMEGARLAKADLDRVLLVGGPTQMPILRAALEAELGAKLDYSVDPMTVVARGAAFYASTLEQTAAPGAKPAVAAKGAAATVALKLSHERASGALQSPIVGILPASSGVHEVNVSAGGGFWTSGWVAVQDDRFLIEVMLNDRLPATSFTLSARDRKGRTVPIEPAQFSIAYMLPMSAPPLPHTIAVELTDHHGRVTWDPIFKRHGPLPADARRTYKADRTLRPSDSDATLPIKFWEIEVSDDPEERWWAGCVHIRAASIRRPIIEGADLELTVKIDASRKMTVEIFVPLLNESFSEGVFVPDPPSARSQLQSQLDLCFDRIEGVFKRIYETDRDDLLDLAHSIRSRLELMAEDLGADARATDPDAVLAPTDALRKIRLQLSHLEEQLETGTQSQLAGKVRGQLRWTEEIVQAHGTLSSKAEVERLGGQYAKYARADDPRGLKWVQEQLLLIRGPILEALPEHWDNVLRYLRRPGRQFLRQAEAEQLLDRAEAAQAEKDLPQMREALDQAWKLQPPDKVQAAKEQLSQSGLRGT